MRTNTLKAVLISIFPIDNNMSDDQDLSDDRVPSSDWAFNSGRRLHTEYYEEELYEGIQNHLFHWIETGLALASSLLVLSLCKYLESSVLPSLFPLMFFDLRAIYLCVKDLAKRSEEFIYRANRKNELFEAVGSLLFYSLQVAYWWFSVLYFSVTVVPFLVSLLLRLFLKNSVTHDCESFSHMVIPRQTLFITRWVKLLTLGSLALRVDDILEYSLLKALWPLWIVLVVLSLSAIGLTLLSLSTLFSYLVQETEGYEVFAAF